MIKTATKVEEIPEYVRKKPKHYKLKEVVKEGKPVFTSDYERAVAKPNFKDHSQVFFEHSETQVEYGSWSNSIDGIAPKELVEQKAALQLKERVYYYYGQKAYPANAQNIRMHYVEPIREDLEIIYTDDINQVPKEARAYAKLHQKEIPCPKKVGAETIRAFPSAGAIPDCASMTDKTRLHGQEIEHEYEWSIQLAFPYSCVYDYEIHTPQYMKRSIQPRKIRVVHELYSFRYDSLEYHWEE